MIITDNIPGTCGYIQNVKQSLRLLSYVLHQVGVLCFFIASLTLFHQASVYVVVCVCRSIDATSLLLHYLHHLLQCNPLQLCLNISMLVLQLLLGPIFAGTLHGFWWAVAVIEGLKLSEIMHPSTGIMPPWLMVVMMMYVAAASRTPLVAMSSTSSTVRITK